MPAKTLAQRQVFERRKEVANKTSYKTVVMETKHLGHAEMQPFLSKKKQKQKPAH